MNAHELAGILLALPDLPVVFGVDDWVYPALGASCVENCGKYPLAIYVETDEAQVIT